MCENFGCPLLSVAEGRSGWMLSSGSSCNLLNVAEMQAHHLSLLAGDISRHYQLNAPILFKDHGQGHAECVIEDASTVEELL